MAINATVIKEAGWGVKLFDDDVPIMALDADTAIRLGLHLILLGQDALHGKALEMVCIDKRLPEDTFADLWNRMDAYMTILNSPQQDTDDESD